MVYFGENSHICSSALDFEITFVDGISMSVVQHLNVKLSIFNSMSVVQHWIENWSMIPGL